MPVTPKKLQELAERMRALGLQDRDLEEKFTRGGGKGGQKVNKTSNCVCLTHAASGIVVKCHRERERETNRFLARRALCDELEHRLLGTPNARQMERKRARKRGKGAKPSTRRGLTLDFRKQAGTPDGGAE